MEPNIVILAAGASSRMKESVQAAMRSGLAVHILARPKCMLPVGEDDKPFLDYLLTNIHRAGYRDAVIVVGEKDEWTQQYYEDRRGAEQFPNLRISFVRQPIPPGRNKPLGTADALVRALQAMPHWYGQRFTVCNSDNLYSHGALQLLLHDNHLNSMIAYDRHGLDFPVERLRQFSVVMIDDDGYLTDIIEKPTDEELERAVAVPERVGVSMNLWRFSREAILPFLHDVPLHPIRQEKELPTAVRLMVSQQPKSVWAIRRSEHVPDLTSAGDIEKVKEYLRQHYA
ncbi:MAG TPA: sugar phosphate nucleotidyltransferase [Bacteroidota bacterium]|nr:sugar phosphate nucleotidyltransferase [Bacteroidota bacterium]